MPCGRYREVKRRYLIESQLAAHGNDVLSVLAQYWRDEAVAAWMRRSQPLRSLSILPKFGIADDRLRAWLCGVRLDDAFVANPGPTWRVVRQALAPHLQPSVIFRSRVSCYMLAPCAPPLQGTASTSVVQVSRSTRSAAPVCRALRNRALTRLAPGAAKRLY